MNNNVNIDGTPLPRHSLQSTAHYGQNNINLSRWMHNIPYSLDNEGATTNEFVNREQLRNHLYMGSGYDCVEFDRGSTWTRFIKSFKRKYGRACHTMWTPTRNIFLSLGFVGNDHTVVEQQDLQQSLLSHVMISSTNYQGINEGTGKLKCGGKVFWHNFTLSLAATGLMLVTALEPVLLRVLSYQIFVDKQHDYRYVLSQVFGLCHLPLAVGSGLWYFISYPKTTKESANIPKVRVCSFRGKFYSHGEAFRDRYFL
jgi:hypothetical protein